ncbi:Carbonic anhydrase [hydrothermal vent metagenome]|uniref:carbonic anhydrase n=1 Tax=hydrothermal vent metagenome TaxID=652676 RepID=A0A1W1ELA1_9ZZZZ
MYKNINDLKNGNEIFREVKFKDNQKRFKQLIKDGQDPKALFIGCSDSRFMPSMITGSNPGDLFVVRNIGNFVAPYKPDEDYHATASAIEYAVSVLEIQDIIVCGHSHCGAIESLYKDIKKSDENTHTLKWLELGQDAKKIAMLTHGKSDKDTRLRYTEKISVMNQLENLLTYPAIKRGVEERKIFLHGWYNDLEKGTIEYYDDESYEFKLLGE